MRYSLAFWYRSLEKEKYEKKFAINSIILLTELFSIGSHKSDEMSSLIDTWIYII